MATRPYARRLPFLVIISFSALSSVAHAADVRSMVGPYVSLGAGVNLTEDSHAQIIDPVPAHFDFKTGYGIFGAAGYKFANGFRPEFEMSWRQADVDTVNGNPWTGHEEIFGLMGNLLYDINVGSKSILPYVGGGIGVARDRFSNVTNRATQPHLWTGHDTNFQWQAIGGVSIPISNKFAAFIEYRYIALDNNRISARDKALAEVIDHDDRSHNVLIGFRYFFHGPKQAKAAEIAAPAPPAPPPRPALPPPSYPEKFLAFFDWDSAALRKDARDVVKEAAAYAQTNGKTVIRVTGHADTSGPASYNMGLSERRAQTIKGELVRLGIPENEITILWKGESEPLIPTGDGVREPQNRRVEILCD